ncbi:MAG: EscU/YscU/HrcU family type III secretion system export apparatus switch protein [Thermodesulfobacteriota bacterium]
MEPRKRQKKAVTLQYEPGTDAAPKVTAMGKGRAAEKIIKIAEEHGIYIHHDPDLIEILSKLDLNEEIPPDLYIVIAELLAFVYSVNRKEGIR